MYVWYEMTTIQTLLHYWNDELTTVGLIKHFIQYTWIVCEYGERERERTKAIIQYTGNYNETQERTYNGLTTVNITERESNTNYVIHDKQHNNSIIIPV